MKCKWCALCDNINSSLSIENFRDNSKEIFRSQTEMLRNVQNMKGNDCSLSVPKQEQSHVKLAGTKLLAEYTVLPWKCLQIYGGSKRNRKQERKGNKTTWITPKLLHNVILIKCHRTTG